MYILIGIIAVVFLVIVTIIKPFESFDISAKILFYGLTILIVVLELTRYRRCVLKIDDDEIYFNDGMLNRTKVPLDLIESIEYHPDLKFRFKLKKHKRKVAMNNVFSLEDQDDIIKTIVKKRHNIKIIYLEKPKHLISKANNKTKKG